MTNTSVRIFGCPTCGFRVDTNEQVCPRCGSEFQEDTKFECPFCGDLVSAGLDQCPSCHVSYSEFKTRAAPKASDDSIDSLLMEIIKLESSSVKEEEKRFSCPQCDLLLEGTETKCPRCGKEMDVEIALQCPVCGALVGAADAKCVECGAVFDEEAVAAAKTEAAESKLEEIMTIAGTAQREEAVRREPRPAPAPAAREERDKGIEFASAMLSKVKEAVRIEPPRKQPPAPEPEPEPLPEPEPVPEPPPAQEEEPEPEPAEAAPAARKAPASGGKKKTRKLKAKPKQ